MRTLSLFLALALLGCASKQTRNSLLSGDYDEAISTATESLRNNRDKKNKQDLIYMLEEAFAKAKERDHRNITFWEKERNPNNYEKIYKTYVKLEQRQEKIRPLLPLKLIDRNKNAQFPFEDYSQELIRSKNDYVEYLYAGARESLRKADKSEIRAAFNQLDYINRLSPGYKNVSQLMEEAEFKGTDYVRISMRNESGVMIPARLEADLLDFSTSGLHEKWTVYHSNPKPGINYDYGVIVNFREILVSPEQVKEREFKVEREIKDGKKKLKDRRGNVVRDSSGNVVMVDNLIIVRATIREFRQTKSARVTAKVDFVDHKSNQTIQTFPLSSEFVFDHMYATYRGDKRAAEDSYRPLFSNRPVPFPSNEQIVFDTGEDLKLKLRNILSSTRIQRR